LPLLDPRFLTNLARAWLLRRRQLRAVEALSRAALLDWQRKRLGQVLRYAAQRSPYYRRRWGGRTPTPDELQRLAPCDKNSLLKTNFDEALTVADFRLTDAEAQVASKTDRPRRPYVVVATSGTTGEPALVPFSRRDWQEGMAHVLRGADWALAGGGLGSPSFLRLLAARPRIAAVSTRNPIHVSTQIAASFGAGLVPTLLLSAATPLPGQQARLTRFQPTVLGGYPSALGPLAAATARGDLPIGPRLVFTGGETVTPTLRQRVRAAWGTELFDFYGLSETLIIAGECREHRGMHVYEDAVVLEVVDEAGRPVPVGEKGAGLVLTSLINRTLPIIRYAVSDQVTLTDAPCPCGLPFRRIVAVEGRREELLQLRNRDGDTVWVHPFVVEAPLEEIQEVRQFVIREDGRGGVRVTVVTDSREDLEKARLTESIGAALDPFGVTPSAVRVETAEDLPTQRGPTGKRIRHK
jgi:phenylacetate-coenzyme A ligase PaaK-like adenylate-forming protein